MSRIKGVICAICSAAAVGLQPATALAHDQAVWNVDVVPEETLRDLRGGLDLGNLVGSFAIDRVISVDGEMVARMSIVIAHLDRLSTGGMPTVTLSGPLAQQLQILSGVPSTSADAPAIGDASSTAVVSASTAGSSNESLASTPETPAAGSDLVRPTVVAASTSETVPLATGRVVVLGLPDSAALATVVQNSVDAAKIQAETTISATLNSLKALESIVLADALRRPVARGH